jgi:hypothetical protein
MMQSGPLVVLFGPLSAAQGLIEKFDNQGLIIGGVASILLGSARFTRDVDVMLLLSTERLPELYEVAQSLGFVPRIEKAVAFARQSRVLLLRHAESGINVDVALGLLPFEYEAVERSTIQQVGPLGLRLPTPEDLIIMKAVAGRNKDMDDISAIAENALSQFSRR